MGTWNVGLYSNDLAEDAVLDFKDVFSVKSPEEGTEILKREYLKGVHSDDLDELADFWYALADWQWGKGILIDEVKEEALRLLDLGAGLELWIESGNKSDIEKRKRVLEELRVKLNTPQPEKKKIRNSCIHYSIKEGDVIAIRPNEKLTRSRKEGSRWIDLEYFDSENTKEDLKSRYEINGNYKLHFSDDYQPILKRENYFLLVCVKKKRHYYKRLVTELYDESLEFLFLDFYGPNIEGIEKRFEELEFFKTIDYCEDGEEKFQMIEFPYQFGFERYKKVGHSDFLLNKSKEIEYSYKNRGNLKDFLNSYEIKRNPKIRYEKIK